MIVLLIERSQLTSVENLIAFCTGLWKICNRLYENTSTTSSENDRNTSSLLTPTSARSLNTNRIREKHLSFSATIKKTESPYVVFKYRFSWSSTAIFSEYRDQHSSMSFKVNFIRFNEYSFRFFFLTFSSYQRLCSSLLYDEVYQKKTQKTRHLYKDHNNRGTNLLRAVLSKNFYSSMPG